MRVWFQFLISILILLNGASGCSNGFSIKKNSKQKTDQSQTLSLDTTSSADARALSNQEYVWSVSDLVGKTYDLSLVKDWTASTQLSGFDSITWSNFNDKSVNDRLTTAEKISEDILQSSTVLKCNPKSGEDTVWEKCPSLNLLPFAERAFRRPLTSTEIQFIKKLYNDSVLQLSKEGLSQMSQYNESLKVVFSSLLISPQFFIKSVNSLNKTDVLKLNAFEVAERLSFLLTGSIPDEELYQSAKNGTILDSKVRRSQFERILQKNKDRFITHFFGQLFEFRRMNDSSDEIKKLFFEESKLVFKELFFSDADLTKYLSPGFTFLNKKLADHYKVSGSFEDSFKRVSGVERGGVLSQGSFLSITGVSIKDSPPLGQPIKRGLWVQSRLLCRPVGVASFELRQEIDRVKGTLNPSDPLHIRLEMHRNAGASCLNCHQLIDPVGISLEKFDEKGRYRNFYDEPTGGSTQPVVTKGELLGKTFDGVNELSSLLSKLTDFRKCMGERTTIFSLGINTGNRDRDFINGVSNPRSDGKPPTFKDILVRIIESKNFTLSQSEETRS